MGSVIYRDRERDRFDDSRTSVSTRRGDGGGGGGGYTTVKRYVVKTDDDNRSSFGGRSRVGGAERVEETRITRREVETEEAPRRYERRDDPRSSERELVIRRDRVEEDTRRDYGRRDERSDDRELVIRRTTEREEPSRERDVALTRYDDRRDYRDWEVDVRREYGDGDIQRYRRTTDYFQPAPQPQTIVIRNEIVMPRREDDFDLVRKSEAEEEKSVVKREPSRSRGEEEFFYEKKVRERIDEPSRRDDDYYEDRRLSKREISPHDSVSQVGRRNRDRDYSSDDSMVYVRNKVTEDEGYDGSRSPKHKRHLAEGVIAGIGAAELLRHHKKQEGKEASGGLGRIGRDVGAGALGALAAQGISRVRSKSRQRSRSRSGSRVSRRSRSRAGSRGRDKSRSRSRSESASRTKKLAGLGLGAAAIAAAAIYAQKKNNEKSESPDGRGRSSSRRRASSVSGSQADDARNPAHRNKRMAEAGAAGAVLAGLIERQRSKSRGRERSKVRTALPIIAAGLGSAGIAAIYEKNKAKKETEAAETEARRASRSRSRSRSRGRGRSADPYYDGPRNVSNPNLIEYGEGNVYGNNYGADYYGQPAPNDSYYNNHQNAVVPAIGAAGAYGAAREARPSRSRSVSSRSSSDGGRRRRRHRKNRESRSRSVGAEAAAAVGGVAAASEYERHKQEKRNRKARRRQEQQEGYGQDPYGDPYNQQHGYAPTPPIAVANDPYASQTGFYPQSTQFPPPPGAPAPQFQHTPSTAYAPGAAYNPSDFPPPPNPVPAAQYQPNFASGGNADPYAPRGRGADENVSPAPAFGNPFSNQVQNHHVPDGVNSNRDVSPFAQPPPPPPPIINIQRPSTSTTASGPSKSNPFLPIPDPFNRFTPTPQSTPLVYPSSNSRSTSQPPPAHRKSVAFAAEPQFAAAASTTTIASSAQSGHHLHADTNRGYDAGDDTDSTMDRTRGSNRSQTLPEISTNGTAARTAKLDPNSPGAGDSGKRRHHRRRRSADPTTSSSAKTAATQAPPDRAASPAPSDETINLPDRFDRKGNKKPEPGEDPLADRLDSILAGKGATGRLFGNFVDGLFGPEGRKKGGSGGGVKGGGR